MSQNEWLTIISIAILEALELLGYKPIYHMKEVGKNRHQERWIAALEAKFERKGKKFEREDWDELLGGYAVSLFEFQVLLWGEPMKEFLPNLITEG